MHSELKFDDNWDDKVKAKVDATTSTSTADDALFQSTTCIDTEVAVSSFFRSSWTNTIVDLARTILNYPKDLSENNNVTLAFITEPPHLYLTLSRSR